MDLDTVRLRAQQKFGAVHTHPGKVSYSSVEVFIKETYDGYFATELILDLTSLDRARRVLLDELEEVLDTHRGRVSHSVLCAKFGN